ncbi:cytochrome P450 family protein [Streptomyces manipurensis]|uniref:cytochrome P450 family protein n=1 Tax=Streptomyces manipurensis TaxID=1077945 RepID=UPI003C6F1AF4
MNRRQCPVEIDAAGSDVHAEAALIRGRGPAVRVVLPGGVGAWAVNGSAEIRRSCGRRVSKDAYRHWPAWIDGEVGERWPLAIWVSVQNMITAYGAEHARLRRPVAGAFTTRRVASMRPRIEEITGELLKSSAAARPGEVVDLRGRLAHELPTRVVFELFGIPERSWAPLHKIIKGFFDTGISAEDAQRNAADLDVTMADLVAYRRAHPGDDLTSALIAARDGHGDGRPGGHGPGGDGCGGEGPGGDASGGDGGCGGEGPGRDGRAATATATAAGGSGSGAGGQGPGGVGGFGGDGSGVGVGGGVGPGGGRGGAAGWGGVGQGGCPVGGGGGGGGVAAGGGGVGRGMSEKELLDNLILLFTAGYETSANLICTALHRLLADPGQLAAVRRGDASWEDAVEEALRVDAPAFYGLLRFAVEDIDMGEGVVIGRGDPIIVSFGAAGRDPAVHGADADRFDVLRPTRGQHLSFGFGTHHCLGAALARAECAIALRRFFERFPDAVLAQETPPDGVAGEGVVGGLPRVESFISNGLARLPVVLGVPAGGGGR